MLTSVLIAVVCTALAYGLWRLLRVQVRHQQAHTEVSSASAPSVPQVVPAAQPVVEQPAPAVEPQPQVELIAEPAQDPPKPVVVEPVAAEPVVAEAVAAEPFVAEPVAAQPAVAPEPEAELEPEVAGPWVMEWVDLEPGQGFICARDGNDKNLLFVEARTRLAEQFGLFQVGKTNADAVRKKEVMLMLVLDLNELATNARIQEAHALGLPVVLMDDLLATDAGEPVKGYLSPEHAPAYRQARGSFQQHWQQTSVQLQPGMEYFLTHSNAGCSLLSEEGQQLADLIGPRLALKAEVPAEQRVDMVVVPTLRTSSRKYLQVIEREQPVLVVKAADLKGVSLGDSIPAWRWRGGEYFQYPVLERKADSHSGAAVG